MSLYNYVDTPNANLICCICRAPFTDPATSLTCSHTFCGDCISRALSHSPTCPVDRTPLRSTDLVPANPIVRSLVDELIVECVYRADGCSYTAQRQIMPQHLRDACFFAEVTCEEKVLSDGGEDAGERICQQRIRRKDQPGHLRKVHGREQEEPIPGERKEGPIRQENGESDAPDVDRKPEETHEEANSCPHASLGCPYNGPSSPSQHLLTCPYESLKGFFSLNTARTATDASKIALLTEQNLILRHKVDTLESTLQVLKREMTATKHALGPWFRSAYASTPYRAAGNASSSAGPSSPSAGSSNASTSVGGGRRDAYAHQPRRSSGDAHAGARMIPSGLEAPGVDDFLADRLASYFPTLPGAENPGQPPHPHPHHPLAGTGGPPTGAPGASFIAPLDLSAPLEGTLGGLHASLGGLAGGVDALGRRSELALANETLRMGEEMMSVRAQMHGLRMQVHGMMMDRNAAFGAGAGAGGAGGFVTHMNMGMGNVVGSPGVVGPSPREEGQFRMGMGFMGPQSITKL